MLCCGCVCSAEQSQVSTADGGGGVGGTQGPRAGDGGSAGGTSDGGSVKRKGTVPEQGCAGKRARSEGGADSGRLRGGLSAPEPNLLQLGFTKLAAVR